MSESAQVELQSGRVHAPAANRISQNPSAWNHSAGPSPGAGSNDCILSRVSASSAPDTAARTRPAVIAAP